jgi:hypothetical protein
MPTTLPRTLVTHTPPVQRALDIAARRWPGEKPGALIGHLISEGAHAVEQAEDADIQARRAQARALAEEFARDFGSTFPDNYLAELREGWPE